MMTTFFKLVIHRRIIFLLFIFLFIHLSYAAPPVGKVISVRGELQAISADQIKRTLGFHAPFYEKDTLVTGRTSNAQILFSDGSIVALPADTVFRVDHYQFDQKHPAKDAYAISLLKGAFRTITGAISRYNPSKYTADTNVSSIGISGTFYGTELSQVGQLVCVTRGGIIVRNQGGSLKLGKGGRYIFAIVPSAHIRPQGSDAAPEFLFKYFSESLYGGLTPNISNRYTRRMPVLDQDVYYQSDAYLFIDPPQRVNIISSINPAILAQSLL